jgi:PAS domain-containing protein
VAWTWGRYVVEDAKRKGRTQKLTPSVYNTLLELYLQDGSQVQHLRQSVVLVDSLEAGQYTVSAACSTFFSSTGYDRGEVIGAEFSTFAEDNDEGGVVVMEVGEAMRSGQPTHQVFRQRRKDGAVQQVFLSVVPIRDRDAAAAAGGVGSGVAAASGISCYVCVFSELPESVFGEGAATPSRVDQLRRLSSQLLLVDAQEMTVVNVSDELAAGLLGGSRRKAAELMNSDYAQFLQSHTSRGGDMLEVSRLRDKMSRRTACSNVRLRSTSATTKDSQSREEAVQLVHATPVRDAAGNVPLFVCLHCDITQEDRALAQQLEAGGDGGSGGGGGGENDPAAAVAGGAASAAGPLAVAAMARRQVCRRRVTDILEVRCPLRPLRRPL